MVPASSNNALVTGGGSLEALRAAAHSDPKAAVKEAAKQFEALFMQEIMKSMRASTMASGMLDNSGTEMATSMLDSQYAMKMSGLPGGLADAIARQLDRQAGGETSGHTSSKSTARATPDWRSLNATTGTPKAASAGGERAVSGSGLERAQQFVTQHGAAAQAVATSSGIPASFMVAQAAHETGWGRREVRGADGTQSFNLFGIKAGGDWKGATVTATTTEVYDGKAVKVEARFRAYGSYEESFQDYARLISQSPRYSDVMNTVQRGGGSGAQFAQGLQKAGYATDPDYARKLSRVIDTAQRLQRATL